MDRLLTAMLAGALLGGVCLGRPPTVSAGPAAVTSPHVVLVLGHPVRLTATLYRWSANAKPAGLAFFKRGSTHKARTVARVLTVLNQVDPITPGVHSCPGQPSRSVIQFGYTNGDTWTVYADGCWGFSTHGMRGTALGDPPVYSSIYGLIDQVAGVASAR